MQVPNHSATQVTPTGETQAPPTSLLTRIKRLYPYFGYQHALWGIAIAATLMGAITEP